MRKMASPTRKDRKKVFLFITALLVFTTLNLLFVDVTVKHNGCKTQNVPLLNNMNKTNFASNDSIGFLSNINHSEIIKNLYQNYKLLFHLNRQLGQWTNSLNETLKSRMRAYLSGSKLN